MDWRLLNFDSFTGTRTYWAWDSVNMKNVVKYEFAPANLDYTQALRNDDDYTKAGLKGDHSLHYAHVPDSVLLHWSTLGVDIGDKKALFEMVNKPEWAYLKTTQLHHS